MTPRGPRLALAAIAIALAAGGLTLGAPLAAATYPPMIDLPFHAAASAIVRHYFDEAWGFREQFELHFLEAPYASAWLLGAALSVPFSPSVAVRVTVFLLLAQVPLGLAVMLRGMKRSAVWALAAVPLAWSHLAHWGFLNHLAALGLSATCVGLALMLVERPSRTRQVALAAALLGVFFTHVFRLPFAVLSVAMAVACAWPVTRRARPVVAPLLIGCAPFAIWWVIRPRSFQVGAPAFGLDRERVAKVMDHLTNDFVARSHLEESAAVTALAATWLALVALAALLAALRLRKATRRERLVSACMTSLALALATVHAVFFAFLPMSLGGWWYVAPREATSALFFALALPPDLPRAGWLRVAFAAILSAPVLGYGAFVRRECASFEETTADFRAVARHIGPKPRLLYMVEPRPDGHRRMNPRTHLVAWVQAERGGTLSFHFASDLGPIRYRAGSAAVPPPMPAQWEWRPRAEDFERVQGFYDTALIRMRVDPAKRLALDPAFTQVDHQGDWWLYVRSPVEGAPR